MASTLVEIPIVIPAYTCSECGHPVVSQNWTRVEHIGRLTNQGVPAQLKQAGVRFSAGYFSNRTICTECANCALATFTCSLCHEPRPSDQIFKTWGDAEGADYVCKPCYATVPAQRYCEFVEEMEEQHRYDFYP